MYFSMVIAQSFLARTFGSYTLQLFEIDDDSWLVPALGVGLLLMAFLINLSVTGLIQGVASLLGFIKIGGIVLFGVVGVWVADSVATDFSAAGSGASLTGFLGATALGILAFKGFTTITNSGSELKDPRRNLGRAIMISIGLRGVYALVVCGFQQPVAGGDYRNAQPLLAAAARPHAESPRSGLPWCWPCSPPLVASSPAFSPCRMLAIDRDEVGPHRHFHMPGSIQKHTLVYTVAGPTADSVLDLSASRRASSFTHHGHRHPLGAAPSAKGGGGTSQDSIIAIAMDRPSWRLSLGKGTSDSLVLVVAAAVIAVILIVEYFSSSHACPMVSRSIPIQADLPGRQIKQQKTMKG